MEGVVNATQSIALREVVRMEWNHWLGMEVGLVVVVLGRGLK